MKKVLVIDDTEANIQLCSFILKKKGHEAIEARSGLEGVDSALKEKPDLILLDIQLLDIDGLEVAKRIRASGANENIPIIAVTSYAMPGDKEKIMEAGCNGYLAKPINVNTFMEEIDKQLSPDTAAEGK
jgi:two-component system cell cycle response regulator DivK